MIVTVNSKNNVNYRFVAIQSGETTDFKMILHVGHPKGISDNCLFSFLYITCNIILKLW